MISHRNGNMLKQNDLDAWIHAANCFCTMGSGIAKEIKETYPEVYEADCKTGKGDKNKLGTFSYARTKDGKFGYSLYGQYNFGRDGKQYTDYDAVKNGLLLIKDSIKVIVGPAAKVGLPYKIGCVLGGGRWEEVLKIIKEVFENDTIELVICELNGEDDNLKKLREAYKKFDLMGQNE